MSQLQDVQRRFFAALGGTAPAAAVATAAATLQGSMALSGNARLDIYRSTMAARQREVLQGQFEQVHRAVGDAAFNTLCCQYVDRYAPRYYSLSRLGAHFAAFLRTQPGQRADLADLAELEWGRIVAWQSAAAQAPATFAQWLARGAARAPQTVFVMHPSLLLVTTQHAVVPLWRTLERHQVPEQPQPQECHTAVWRDDKVVAHQAQTPAEAQALAAALRGDCFVDLCSAFLSSPDPPQQTLTTLHSWFSAGWIVALQGP